MGDARGDGFREKAQEFIQQIMEEEVTELLGREKSERRSTVDSAEGYRNGYGKPRRLAMSSGTITLRRPHASLDAHVSIQDVGKDGGDQNSRAAPYGQATPRSDHRPCWAPAKASVASRSGCPTAGPSPWPGSANQADIPKNGKDKRPLGGVSARASLRNPGRAAGKGTRYGPDSRHLVPFPR